MSPTEYKMKLKLEETGMGTQCWCRNGMELELVKIKETWCCRYKKFWRSRPSILSRTSLRQARHSSANVDVAGAGVDVRGVGVEIGAVACGGEVGASGRWKNSSSFEKSEFDLCNT